MTSLLSEFRVAIALALVATVVPLLWAAHDSHRRLALKQVAWQACWSHHELRACDGLRPAELPQGWQVVCEMRFDPRSCARLAEAP